jgi:hypothetical protein
LTAFTESVEDVLIDPGHGGFGTAVPVLIRLLVLILVVLILAVDSLSIDKLERSKIMHCGSMGRRGSRQGQMGTRRGAALTFLGVNVSPNEGTAEGVFQQYMP